MTDFEGRMAALRARFVDQARDEAAAIACHVAAGEWQSVRDICHGLAGRAGMFGFAALGDAARAVEEAIDEGAPPERLALLADALLGAFDQGR